MKIFIIGAGTQGKFVLDLINSIPGFEAGGFYDDRYPEIKSVNGLKVIGKIDETVLSFSRNLALGIGEPEFRKRVFEEKEKQGYLFPLIIHPGAVISSLAKIKDGVTIGPFSTVLCGSIVGRGACILSHVNINQDVSVGDFSLTGAGAVIGNQVKIGEGCHIGMGTVVKPGESVLPWTDYSCSNEN